MRLVVLPRSSLLSGPWLPTACSCTRRGLSHLSCGDTGGLFCDLSSWHRQAKEKNIRLGNKTKQKNYTELALNQQKVRFSMSNLTVGKFACMETFVYALLPKTVLQRFAFPSCFFCSAAKQLNWISSPKPKYHWLSHKPSKPHRNEYPEVYKSSSILTPQMLLEPQLTNLQFCGGPGNGSMVQPDRLTAHAARPTAPDCSNRRAFTKSAREIFQVSSLSLNTADAGLPAKAKRV